MTYRCGCLHKQSIHRTHRMARRARPLTGSYMQSNLTLGKDVLMQYIPVNIVRECPVVRQPATTLTRRRYTPKKTCFARFHTDLLCLVVDVLPRNTPRICFTRPSSRTRYSTDIHGSHRARGNSMNIAPRFSYAFHSCDRLAQRDQIVVLVNQYARHFRLGSLRKRSSGVPAVSTYSIMSTSNIHRHSLSVAKYMMFV